MSSHQTPSIPAAHRTVGAAATPTGPTGNPTAGPAPLRRRTVLSGAAGGGLLAGHALAGTGAQAAPAHAQAHRISTRPAPSRLFQHGIASGDPLADRVVIWTRVTPTPEATAGSGKGPQVALTWEVSRDRSFRQLVRRGRARTGSARDHTLKVDVTGLTPATTYFFRFRVGRHLSPTGRTRTAPDRSARALRFGVVSCSNYDAGYFSPYRHLAARDDLDAVLHLGDYLYEYENGGYGDLRSPEPAHEIVSLADYRRRHASYKQDPDLAALHARVPFVTVWDDHEVTNNSWRDGAENHDDAEGDYAHRKARAHRAYDEWMPVRLDGTARLGDGTRLYRTIRYGDLAELVMLDLRSHRDEQAAMPNSPQTASEETTITGPAQMRWLKKRLSESTATWKLVGNSVIISPLGLGGLPREAVDALEPLIGPFPQDATANTDQWDGYTADRRELLDHIEAEGISDVVFLTGDVHTSWAIEVPVELATYPLSGTAGVEFVITSVTSDNLDSLDDPDLTEVISTGLRASNRHIKYLDAVHHGYGVLTLDAGQAQMDYWAVSDRLDPDATTAWQAGWLTEQGSGRLARASGPVS